VVRRTASVATPYLPIGRVSSPARTVQTGSVSPKRKRKRRGPVSARSVYQLHVIDPASERHTGLVLTFLAEAVLSSGSSVPTFNANSWVRLEIVDLRTGGAVSRMRETIESVHALATRIEADLDRLDARAFANEWGIDATPTS
jgi:hypothetical protein